VFKKIWKRFFLSSDINKPRNFSTQTMLQRILNGIGDWNPQLLREWQGRFKPWDVTGAFAVSAIAQFIFMTYRRGKLPLSYTENNFYCTGDRVAPPSGNITLPKAPHVATEFQPLCLKDQGDNVLINWELWRQDNFTLLTQILLGAVIVAGVYWLISDFIFEERRGTLNFVRLSPRSGKEILWGKLLGVPTLVYVALGVAIPFHLYAAVQAQIPLGVLMGTYVVGAASGLFFWSGALLWSVTTSALGYLQTWAGAGFAALTVWGLMNAPYPSNSNDPGNWLWSFDPSIMVRHLMKSSYPREFVMNWFDLNYNAIPWSTTLFITVYLSVWTYWIWQALQRRFQNIGGTALSKKQSYGFTACFVASVTGFAWGGYSSATLSFVCPMCLVVVMMITPNRQRLHEWARYRHQMPRKSLSDLLWGEKSPALLAVAVNMAIATTLLIPVVVFNSGGKLEGLLELLAFAIAVLMMAAIFQALLMVKAPKMEMWAVGVWVICWIVPVMVTNLLGISPSYHAVWVFSVTPWVAVRSVTLMSILPSLIAQLGMFGLLTNRLIRQLDRAGASESKALLT
jgi:hypothetical protein